TMFKKTGLIIFITIFVILGMTAGIVSATSLGSLPQTLYVDDLDDGPGNNYTSIQAALNNASSGDTILVYPGAYLENVKVTKADISIKATSEDPADTTVQATDSNKSVFNVTCNKVTIRGFTINDSLNSSGIHLVNVTGVNIISNTLLNNFHGIQLSHSDNNTITGNNVTGNDDDGIDLDNSNNNTLNGNNVTGNDDDGIDLDNSNNNTLNGNYVTGNEYDGFYMECSDNNTLNDNILSNNSETGLYMIKSRHNDLENNLMNNNSGNFYVGEYEDDLDAEDAFVNNISTTNRIDGKPVYYLVGNSSGIEITSSSNAGTVYLINCENVLVKNLTLENNCCGLFIYNSSGIRVLKNNVSNNMNGMVLYGSEGITLSENTVKYNEYSGIFILNSTGSILTDNLVSGNFKEGTGVGASAEKALVERAGSEYLPLESGLVNIDSKKVLVERAGSEYLPLESGLVSTDDEKALVGSDSDIDVSAEIDLKNSPNSTLTGNTVMNGSYGIAIKYSENCCLTENTVMNGSYGIAIKYSENC
ncbi:MAG: NosD domain-containing protein, partial [Methanosarcinaceae archaeon]|nr:NosD domain-containing protein [Methanosarcinaceae archaeon]